MQSSPHRPASPRFSLRELIWVTALVAMTIAWWTVKRERNSLRDELGYLPASASDQSAVVRLTSDQPLTYRFRVRVPMSPSYRISYSTVWPKGAAKPDWFAGAPVPSGESTVTVRIARDPRDDQWKITTLVRSDRGTNRVATVLPEDHVKVFRGSHDALSTGVGRQAAIMDAGQTTRILDERWLVGEGALMLYGDSGPKTDQIGIYAELQPADHRL